MNDDEIERFLTEHGSGVLSLARDGFAYGIPVSYGYGYGDERCLLDLGFGPESKKRSFLETTRKGSLTVYEWNSPTEWASVVLVGEVRSVPGDVDRDVEERYYEFANGVEIDVFDRPPEEVDLEWYEFDIEEWSGRSSD